MEGVNADFRHYQGMRPNWLPQKVEQRLARHLRPRGQRGRQLRLRAGHVEDDAGGIGVPKTADLGLNLGLLFSASFVAEARVSWVVPQKESCFPHVLQLRPHS
jgi:hypothetical protein